IPSPSSAPRALALMSRGRVLVVDDEPLMLAAVRRMLAPEHDVTATESAREAAALVATGLRFDLILCDLMMQEMTGMELYAQLLARAPEQGARMTFRTGGVYPARAREFVESLPARRLHLVHKPFDGDELRRLVRERIA